MRTIDYDEALELLNRAVEAKGADHLAPVCVIYDYADIDSKQPRCIVGQAIYEAVGRDKFQDVDNGAVLTPAASVGINLTSKAASLWRYAQHIQDGSNHGGRRQPWGKSVAEAVKAVNALD